MSQAAGGLIRSPTAAMPGPITIPQLPPSMIMSSPAARPQIIQVFMVYVIVIVPLLLLLRVNNLMSDDIIIYVLFFTSRFQLVYQMFKLLKQTCNNGCNKLSCRYCRSQSIQ